MNTNNALIAQLTITVMGNSRKDTQLTQAIHTANNMADQAGHYQKQILPKDCLKPLTKLRSFVRTAYEDMTLTTDLGRILPAARTEHFLEVLRTHQRAWNAKVATFISDYPKNKERAKVILGPAYDPALYPAVETLQGMFRFEFGLIPLPSIEAFDQISGIADQRVNMLKRQLQESTEIAAREARNQLMERIRGPLERVFQMCSDPEMRVDPRTLENLDDILNLAADYNLTGDEQITRLVEDARRTLNLARESIRDNPQARSRNAAALQALNKAYGLGFAPRRIATPAGTPTAPAPAAPTLPA